MSQKVTVTVSPAMGLDDNSVVPQKDAPTFEIEIPQELLGLLRQERAVPYYQKGYLPIVIHDQAAK